MVVLSTRPGLHALVNTTVYLIIEPDANYWDKLLKQATDANTLIWLAVMEKDDLSVKKSSL